MLSNFIVPAFANATHHSRRIIGKRVRIYSRIWQGKEEALLSSSGEENFVMEPSWAFAESCANESSIAVPILLFPQREFPHGIDRK